MAGSGSGTESNVDAVFAWHARQAADESGNMPRVGDKQE